MLSHAAQCTRNAHPLPSQPDNRHTQISQTGNNSARKLASLFGKSDANLQAGYSSLRVERVGDWVCGALQDGDKMHGGASETLEFIHHGGASAVDVSEF